jgi:beta-phosphoglucomutase-like phosphatase (HAD superfamily)
MIASRFELVIFDCDGVLVDSEPSINRAHADVLAATVIRSRSAISSNASAV